MSGGIVIIGASHAGVQVATSLRDFGYEGIITLINGEAAYPYQRPPLSKAVLYGGADVESLSFRSPTYYADKSIDIVNDTWVTAIDRTDKKVTVKRRGSDSGITQYHFDHLVIATGALAKPLSVPGGDLPNVICIRSIEDALRLKEAFLSSKSVVVAGAGFIGLEVASTLVKLGIKSTVIVRGERLLSRLFPPVMSDFLIKKHEASGSNFLFNSQIVKIEKDQGSSVIVHLDDGQELHADAVVVGIGTTVSDELARSIGLICNDGIVVDESCVTSDPSISACGDCSIWKQSDKGTASRIESVQTAVDQAKTIAARLTGAVLPERVAPWFWSDQLDLKLQMVGTELEYDDLICRGEIASNKFSLLYFQKENLVRVDSINSAADHIAARKLVSKNAKISKELAKQPSIKLKDFL
mgnify:FL=1